MRAVNKRIIPVGKGTTFILSKCIVPTILGLSDGAYKPVIESYAMVCITSLGVVEGLFMVGKLPSSVPASNKKSGTSTISTQVPFSNNAKPFTPQTSLGLVLALLLE